MQIKTIIICLGMPINIAKIKKKQKKKTPDISKGLHCELLVTNHLIAEETLSSS